MEQLTSDSILLVRRQDVVNRFRDWSPLNDLITKKDKRWNDMNVLGTHVKRHIDSSSHENLNNNHLYRH